MIRRNSISKIVLTVNFFLLCAAFLYAATAVAALNEVSVKVSLDKDQAFVGDVINFAVKAEIPEGSYVSASQKIVFDNFDILYSSVNHVSEKPNIYALDFGIASYETGRRQIEPVGIIYIDPAGKKGMFFTQPAEVHIENILTGNISDIKDIKPPKNLTVKKRYLAASAVILILVLLLFVLVIRDFVKKEPVIKTEFIDPKTDALNKLDALFNSGVMQDSDPSIFYYKTAEILRTYISKKYEFNAMEMTSGELVKKLEETVNSEIAAAEIKEYLKIFDLARYAGYKPFKDAINDSYEKTREFIVRL
jgi:hypothetical protein